VGRHACLWNLGKTLWAALANIVTVKNVAIALFTAIIGHLGFEVLRRKS
jgi:hypothetical protein